MLSFARPEDQLRSNLHRPVGIYLFSEVATGAKHLAQRQYFRLRRRQDAKSSLQLVNGIFICSYIIYL